MYIIKLYDYIEAEDTTNVYYTVCCKLGEGDSLYEEPTIVRLLTDIVNTSSIIGHLSSLFVSKLIRKSFRRDNKWQREATDMLTGIIILFEKISIKY
jgi:hypothetical protein